MDKNPTFIGSPEQMYTVLVCPFCGDRKEILNLICAGGLIEELWSDTRVIMPYMPVIFPIQKCKHCGKYYFINEEQYINVDIDAFVERLSFSQLKEAKVQFGSQALTLWDKEKMYMEILRGYNETFRCQYNDRTDQPTGEDVMLFYETIDWLLHESKEVRKDYILYSEILREGGYFQECINMLNGVTDQTNMWIIRPILERAKNGDTNPVLLIKSGKKLAND
ncbi:MAG: hypothetical protein K2O49_07770 [Muribaculaceae bacterium]|nr:hypothetical protein [Muribaculaceae bacterium]